MKAEDRMIRWRAQAALNVERQQIQEAAEEALRNSEERLRFALDASVAGTWSWDVATNRATWDERFQRLYGFEAQEPCSFDTWIGRVHPGDREYLLTRIQSLLTATGDNEWNEEFPSASSPQRRAMVAGARSH